MTEYNTINSHIQMPKRIMKEFEKDNRLAYYDVKGNFIGTNGHAKSIYTELGYYSEETEHRLNREVESPLSHILYQIHNIDFTQEYFDKPKDFDIIVRKYLDSLLIRSTVMQDAIGQNSIFYNNLPEQQRHDIAVNYGLALSAERSFVNNYIATFVLNNTKTQFVLPVCGMYEFKLCDYLIAILPIMPNLALALLEPRSYHSFVKDGAVKRIYIPDENVARRFNAKAVKKQIDYNTGFVVASEKRFLEEALSYSID